MSRNIRLYDVIVVAEGGGGGGDWVSVSVD